MMCLKKTQHLEDGANVVLLFSLPVTRMTSPLIEFLSIWTFVKHSTLKTFTVTLSFFLKIL